MKEVEKKQILKIYFKLLDKSDEFPEVIKKLQRLVQLINNFYRTLK